MQLTEDNRCRIFGKDVRPGVCNSYKASFEFCGRTREEALCILTDLELRTNSDTHGVREDVRSQPQGSPGARGSTYDSEQ